MSRTKPSAEAVRNATSDGWNKIYLIISGFAITQALKQTLTDQNGNFLGTSLEYLDNGVHVLLLITFLFTIIRFAHGSILHLTALTSEAKWQWDMFGLLLQAILFYVVALTINKTSYFLLSFFLILLIDSLWLLFLEPLGHLNEMEKKWLSSNVIMFIIFFVLYISYCYQCLNNISVALCGALLSQRFMTSIQTVENTFQPDRNYYGYF
jgi:hypothetical protein